eukprot:INCI686.3.p1 GENE.INCI686.3~~INCI686.3.p1  ORF type:complete len:413 (-),score=79.30 INCI686.3:814-2052(-)
MASRSRRARQNRHQGSGRVTTRRPIQLNRHSQFGISAPTRSALDESEDFEDVDEFFFRNSSTAESTPGTALSEGSPGSSDGEATTTASSQRTRRRASAESTSKKKTPGKARRTPTPRTASPKKRLSFGGSSVSPAEQSDMGGGEQPDDFDDDFDDHGDDGFDDEEAEEEGLSPEPPRDHGRRKHAKAKAVDLDSPEVGQPSAKKGRGSSAKGAKQNKGKKKTPQKRKAPQPRTFSTPDPNLLDNSIDEDAPDRLQPLDNDRPPTPGVRRSKRARYKPLAHWKNERVTTSVFHTKDGHLAIKTKAQRDGVPTPVIKRGRNQGGASTPFAKRNELKGKKAGGSKATKSSAGRKKGASAEKDEPAPVVLPDGFEESDQTVMPILVKVISSSMILCVFVCALRLRSASWSLLPNLY